MAPGKIQFPCFRGETFYFYVHEIDEEQQIVGEVFPNGTDTLQTQTVGRLAASLGSLKCDELEMGANEIVLTIYEDKEALEDLYLTHRDSITTNFTFLKTAAEKSATYAISLHVTDNCDHFPFVDEEKRALPGNIMVGSVNERYFWKRIHAEEWNPNPGIMWGGGESTGHQHGSTERLMNL